MPLNTDRNIIVPTTCSVSTTVLFVVLKICHIIRQRNLNHDTVIICPLFVAFIVIKLCTGTELIYKTKYLNIIGKCNTNDICFS